MEIRDDVGGEKTEWHKADWSRPACSFTLVLAGRLSDFHAALLQVLPRPHREVIIVALIRRIELDIFNDLSCNVSGEEGQGEEGLRYIYKDSSILCSWPGLLDTGLVRSGETPKHVYVATEP